MKRQLASLLAPLRARISSMVLRGVVRTVNDGAKLQEMKIGTLGNSEHRRAERFQPFGLTGVPPVGAEAVVVYPQGNSDHPLVIACEDRASRPTGLSEGEVLLYSTGGARLYLKADGSLRITSQDEVEVTADKITATASSNLTLKVGTQKIEITTSGITISATQFNVNQV
jgi:phage baseplate assembly protein V